MHQESRSEKGPKLFGVRILCGGGGRKEEAAEDVEEVIRKSKSTGNLVACGSSPAAESGAGDSGYLSDGGLFQSSRRRRGRERKRGVPWTEGEHRAFLAGLKMLGKGDWRGISRSFVTTRTPCQVASHAQKYFLRQSNANKKKRRSSLFDVVISDPEKTPASEGTEASLALPLIEGSREAASIHNVNHMQAGISGYSKDQVVPTVFPTPPLHISNQTFPSCQASSTACATDFLRVPFSSSIQLHAHHPTRSTAAPPAPESNDLELNIAPPQLHSLTKLSSPKAGVDGVV